MNDFSIPCPTQLDAGPCAGTLNHPGDCSFHADDIAVPDICGAKPGPNSQATCNQAPIHTGPHTDQSQGMSWPQNRKCWAPNHAGALFCHLEPGHSGTAHRTRDENGTLHTWFGPTFEISPLNPYVLATVELHAARSRQALADVVAALEGLPTLSARARELRSRKTRLMAETDAWGQLEDYAKGVRT